MDEMATNRRSIIEKYLVAYNNFDVDGMLTNLDSDVVFENISAGNLDLSIEGKEAFKKQAEAATSYFSERKQVASSWEFTDTAITIKVDYHAVLAMDFPNGMKAGDTLQLSGKSTFVFKDEKIIRITDES